MTINTTKQLHSQFDSGEDTPKSGEHTMTNREWLESLSDDELFKYIDCRELPLKNYHDWLCTTTNRYDYLTDPSVCVKCKLLWLKAEHKEVSE